MKRLQVVPYRSGSSGSTGYELDFPAPLTAPFLTFHFQFLLFRFVDGGTIRLKNRKW